MNSEGIKKNKAKLRFELGSTQHHFNSAFVIYALDFIYVIHSSEAQGFHQQS